MCVAVPVRGHLARPSSSVSFSLSGEPYMRPTYMIDMAVGASCLVLALMTVSLLLDKNRSRPRWATVCLITLAVVGLIAGVMTGFAAAGRPVPYLRPGRVYYLAGCFRWFMVGLFLPLASSGHWSGSKPSK